jgi:hypothetical protein
MRFYIPDNLYSDLELLLNNKLTRRIKVNDYDFATKRVVNDLLGERYIFSIKVERMTTIMESLVMSKETISKKIF